VDSGWRFIRQDVAGAQTNGFDDSSWTVLNLPHTWNNLDGQDGGNNYYRGIGWYRLHYAVNTNAAGQRLFLKFDGANIVSDVYVNGNFIGEHQGGFAAFVFDVTPYINFGADNVIAVKVNNAANSNVPPLSADFTFFGGLYRDVHLLTTDPVHVSPLDYGSPGVYLKPTNVSSASANLQITTVVSNANAVAANVTVRAIVTDAATNIVTTLTNMVTLPAASISNVVASTVIANPHLWNGLADPYLYRAYVEVYNGTNLTDLVSQPLGFRFFSVDPTNGFFLNGRYYDLHGVSVHQDWLNCGWALTNAQRETNFAFLRELGVTAYRMAHYQKNDYEYQLADKYGIILWSEIPLVNSTTETTNFYNNAKQQLRELIRQNYNHPAVVCWGMYNELSIGLTTALVGQLVQLEAQEDPTRPSTAAVLASTDGDANAWTPQLVAFNEYFGWYESPLNGIASWADTIHAAHPTNCIGISEYGAGASIYQHSEDPVAWPTTTGGLFHPEEWQNLVHETNWIAMKARPFLWCKFVWNMFNFAVDSRNEGDTPGRNDKGLVTYDRLARKDAFYFYKANWTTNPIVYITGHTFTNRTTSITAKVYANCDSVELFVNGVSLGSQTGSGCIFTWPITLQPGNNSVSAVGTKGSTQVTDSLVWIGVPPPISQGQPVTASSFQTGNDPSHGNDGSLSTRWSASDATYPQWWRVDLGSVQPIAEAIISWYNASSRAYQYRIEISNDDVSYTVLVDNTGNNTNGNTTNTFSASARYVRITVTGVIPTGGWAGFYEFQIFGVTPPTLGFQQLPGVLRLSWPVNNGNWSLQAQTSSLTQGLSTNWTPVPNSSATNQMDFPISPANPAVFYRLVFQ
jgi:beta-galactosidase